MRKRLIFLLVLSFLFISTRVSAQSNVQIKELSIQFWPEYDRPEMLVMYTFSLSEDSSLPANLKIRVPANADLTAVAKETDEKPINVPYDAPIREDDWIVVTLTITDLETYRVEYYAPLEKTDSNRNFSFRWEDDVAVENLFIEVQQPLSARNFKTTPTLPDTREDELTYHTFSAGGVKAGDIFGLEISYEKDNDNLTVSSMPIEVVGAPENGAGSFSLSDSLPMILVGVGILLIVGGLLYFFLAGRSNHRDGNTRKRHAPSTVSSGGNIYCHECGSRASAGDKFCRSCGVKLRV